MSEDGNQNRSVHKSKGRELAVLAGGCFWGMQDLIRKLPGVVKTRVGYTGGDVPNATYRNHGSHAEAIEIEFDPTRISYRELLEFFFQIHDPTTLNRQGNDVGTSYRSEIFYVSEAQRDGLLQRCGAVRGDERAECTVGVLVQAELREVEVAQHGGDIDGVYG